MKKLSLAAIAISLASFAAPPFTVDQSIFNFDDPNTLGLQYPDDIETFTVYSASDSTDHFVNGAVVTQFKGALYCMWQTSLDNEDSPETRVAYSHSLDDGATWSAPQTLCPTLDNGYCTSGGWISTPNTLVAFINIWPDTIQPVGGFTQYILSTDGQNWTTPQYVTMADASIMPAVIEQDPHQAPDGRWINAAHFQPGLYAYPIYTDCPLGITGWHKADFTPTPNRNQSRELEPSLFFNPDGSIVMIFRDQKSTFTKLASLSTDNGLSWTLPTPTSMPDARTKQSAGNLPSGTPFLVGNPNHSTTRIPLAITLASTTTVPVHFNRAFLLRAGGETMPPVKYNGKAKRLGYSYPKTLVTARYLYVAYTTNKEHVEITRIPLPSLLP